MARASTGGDQKVRKTDARRERRMHFLAEAAEVLAENGFHETTMDMIAERLGVAKVILYRHFASKEDLIHNILESVADKLVALDATPEESVTIRALETLKLARNNRAAFILLVRHARNDVMFGEHFSRVHITIATRLTEVFLGASFDSVLSRMSAEAIADLVVNGALNWITFGDAERDEDYAAWVGEGITSICRTWRVSFLD